nr:ABC transporter component [Kibdelosporangium sp. MJ126-NF4]CTQ97774.1 ABC transporter component [Kibdelosporangium sp. MJ126-NF4]
MDDAITEQHTAGRRAMWPSVPGILAGGFGTQLAFTVLIVTGVLLALGGSVAPVTVVAVLALAAPVRRAAGRGRGAPPAR